MALQVADLGQRPKLPALSSVMESQLSLTLDLFLFSQASIVKPKKRIPVHERFLLLENTLSAKQISGYSSPGGAKLIPVRRSDVFRRP